MRTWLVAKAEQKVNNVKSWETTDTRYRGNVQQLR